MTSFKGTVDALAHLLPFPSWMGEPSCYEAGILTQWDTRALMSNLSIRPTKFANRCERRGPLYR